MRSNLLALILLAGGAAAQVPTPESVLGYKPGADFKLATYEDSLGYFQKLAASSNRIKLVNVGKSSEGREKTESPETVSGKTHVTRR